MDTKPKTPKRESALGEILLNMLRREQDDAINGRSPIGGEESVSAAWRESRRIIDFFRDKISGKTKIQ